MRHVALDAQTVGELLSEWQQATSDPGVMALIPEAQKDKFPILQSLGDYFSERHIPCFADK